MQLVTQKLRSHGLVSAIYVATLLLSFHYVFVVYVNSNFLEQFFTERVLGLLYTIGSVINIIAFLFIAQILEKVRNYRMMLYLTVLEGAVLVGMATFTNPFVIMALFVLHHAINPMILFGLDIFLERLSDNSHTGGIRATFMTIANATFVLSPLLVGFILGEGENFPLIYILSAGFLVPFFVIIYHNFRNLPHKPYKRIEVKATFLAFWRNKKLWNVYMVGFILQFFYTWMTIYTPLYLHDTVGFNWKEIGIIFSVMLLPFVIFEIPLGRIADKKYGEKEIMTVGIIVMALATLCLSFITSKNIALWALLLFVTRSGASAIEIMTESYFFKQVNADDTSLISFFRNSRPLSYIIAPVAAGAALVLIDNQNQYLFFVLGIITLLGLRYSLSLEDTK
jgi:MFS family permease